MADSGTLNDHDLLIRIDERVGVLMKWSESHDKSHKRTTKVLGGIAAGVGALTGFFSSFLHK